MSKVIEAFDGWAKAAVEGDEKYLADHTPAAGRARKAKRGRDVAESAAAAEPVEFGKEFDRPNGEMYVSRKLGDKLDVDVCRIGRTERQSCARKRAW